jgi:hypothetical protein
LAEQAISKFRSKGRGGSVARGASPVAQRTGRQLADDFDF